MGHFQSGFSNRGLNGTIVYQSRIMLINYCRWSEVTAKSVIFDWIISTRLNLKKKSLLISKN